MVKNPPSSAGDAGAFPGRGAKLPRAAGQTTQRSQKKKNSYCKMLISYELMSFGFMVFIPSVSLKIQKGSAHNLWAP